MHKSHEYKKIGKAIEDPEEKIEKLSSESNTADVTGSLQFSGGEFVTLRVKWLKKIKALLKCLVIF